MRYFLFISIILSLLSSCTFERISDIKITSKTNNGIVPNNAALIASTSGKGKYIILHHITNTPSNTIYIKQFLSHSFYEYTIESLEGDIWYKIDEGSNAYSTIVLRFEPRSFSKLRLHIKRSYKIAHVEHFSLYYDHDITTYQ